MTNNERESSRDGWHGAKRKSRRKRLPTSSAGASLRWEPTEVDWATLGQAYGVELEETVRKGVAAAVQGYIDWEAYEGAEFADDFQKKLVVARDLARKLQEVVYELGDGGSLVAPYWRRACPLAGAPRFERAVSLICGALSDTFMGLNEDDAPAFGEGDAWVQLVVDVGVVLRTAGMKVTVSKGMTKKPSQFVSFFASLQLTLPETLRRHPTDDGLKLAISNALSIVRRKLHDNSGLQKMGVET
ncbi:MAG: hypothetical protein EKK29_17210 [Hyphomicrobiales bacterium]|nr:MAG: hypothetical protein EKK29_17210 [Hyphomicrobiales bacterium]